MKNAINRAINLLKHILKGFRYYYTEKPKNDSIVSLIEQDFKRSRQWTYIMIHHSLTKDGKIVNTDAIRRYHKEVKGWRDIGYHYLVERVDNTYVVKIGRSLADIGAHCKDGRMNYKAIGICLIGNFDIKLPPVEQLILAKRLVSILSAKFNISYQNLVTHNEYNPHKTCAGKLISGDMWRRIFC